MKRIIQIFIAILIAGSFFIPEDLQARETRKSIFACCAPDSLEVISLNCPEFCVRWRAKFDSICDPPIGFEIQWRHFGELTWHSKLVPFNFSLTIDFCDTASACGTNFWRVRVICYGNVYSDWAESNFKMPCTCDFPGGSRLSVSPNPVRDAVFLSSEALDPGPVHLSVLNSSGKPMYDKMMVFESRQAIREKVPVYSWPRGMYYLRVEYQGRLLGIKPFLKE